VVGARIKKIMNASIRVLAVGMVVGLTGVARGQVPFIAPGATAFDPQISVLTTGSLNDVQANVSRDRKYVTITAQPSNSQLLALQSFAFQRAGGGLGFAGGAGGATVATGRAAATGPAATRFEAGSILAREGMTRLSP
jgi:hypothetical protein